MRTGVWRRRTCGLALVACLSAGRASSEQGAGWASQQHAIDLAIREGRWSTAESLTQSAWQALPPATDLDTADIVDSRERLIESAIAVGDIVRPSILQWAQRVLETRRRLNGPDSLAAAGALHRLGHILLLRADYAQARHIHQMALTIRTRLAGPQSPEVADSLEQLARVEMRTERYQSARQRLERVLSIRARAGDHQAPSLELRAWLERYAGDYPQARTWLDRARAAAQAEGQQRPTVSAQQLEGDLLMLEGAPPRAYDVWSAAAEQLRSTVRDASPALVALERRIALAAAAMGNRPDSLRHMAAGLDLALTKLTPCDPERIGLEDYAASSAMYDGDFNEAQARYNAVLQSCRRCLGESHANTATVNSNLASLALLMGNLAEAERLNREALRIWAAIDPKHPFIAEGLDSLAEVVALRGRPASAEASYMRALEIRRGINVRHPGVALTLTNLARLKADRGQTESALALVEQALTIYRSSGSAADPDHLARTLLLHGDLLARQGDGQSALTSFTEALQARTEFFGASHPLTADSRARLARAKLGLGDQAGALVDALAAEQIAREHLQNTVRMLPERTALYYANARPEGLGVALSALVGLPHPIPPTTVTAVVDALVRSRAAVLDELVTRRFPAGDHRVREVASRLAVSRQRLANLILRSMSGDGDAVPQAAIELATAARDDAETELASISREFRATLESRSIGVEDVQRHLPADAALISFVKFQSLSRSSSAMAAGGFDTQHAQYAAFVNRAGSPAKFIGLGQAKKIDGLVKQWRKLLLDEAASGTRDAPTSLSRLAGKQLREAIWDPIAAQLEEATRVFIVPDGDVNLVPFAALPVAGSEYLLTTGPLLHYLSTERDIVRLDGSGSSAGAGLLAFGAAAFSPAASPASEMTLSTAAAHRGMEATRSSTPCSTTSSLQFLPLPGTAAEISTVSRLWRQRPGGVDPDVVRSGSHATETAFKKLAPGRRFLHLATHAFSFDTDCSPTTPGSRSAGGLSARLTKGRSDRQERALALSGLAFAGANEPKSASGADDGILTAEEIVSLDLTSVEWAVLSACDTGRGSFLAGEGVIGLRRSFQLAGARTVVMSLWPIEDRSTTAWMAKLYQARFASLGTAESIRAASVAFIQERRSQRMSAHPFYWAGFVAAGDWH